MKTTIKAVVYVFLSFAVAELLTDNIPIKHTIILFSLIGALAYEAVKADKTRHMKGVGR